MSLEKNLIIGECVQCEMERHRAEGWGRAKAQLSTTGGNYLILYLVPSFGHARKKGREEVSIYNTYIIYAYIRTYTYIHVCIVLYCMYVCVCVCTITIRLSACPLKCTILLSALSIEVKIPIKKITLFMMKLHQTKLKLCSKHSKNNKRKEFLTKIKFKRICYVMVGGVSWKCTKRNARKKRTKFRNRSLKS